MADVFKEIDEDLRRENLKRLARRLGPYVLFAAVVIIGAVGVNSVFKRMQERDGKDAAALYYTAQDLVRDQDFESAVSHLTQLEDTGTGGYGSLSRLKRSSIELERKNFQVAVEHLRSVMSDESVPAPIRRFARARAAWVLLEIGDANAVEEMVQPLLGNDPFDAMARSAMMLARYQEGNLDVARTLAEALLEDHAGSSAAEWAGVIYSFLQADGLIVGQKSADADAR